MVSWCRVVIEKAFGPKYERKSESYFTSVHLRPVRGIELGCHMISMKQMLDGGSPFLSLCREHRDTDFKAFGGICERLYIGRTMYYLSKVGINKKHS